MNRRIEIKDVIVEILKTICKDSSVSIALDKAIYTEYSLDSIQFVQFMLMIENVFEIKLSDTLLDKIGEATINDFVEEIKNLEKSKNEKN